MATAGSVVCRAVQGGGHSGREKAPAGFHGPGHSVYKVQIHDCMYYDFF